jgi:hypothetical protein
MNPRLSMEARQRLGFLQSSNLDEQKDALVKSQSLEVLDEMRYQISDPMFADIRERWEPALESQRAAMQRQRKEEVRATTNNQLGAEGRRTHVRWLVGLLVAAALAIAGWLLALWR